MSLELNSIEELLKTNICRCCLKIICFDVEPGCFSSDQREICEVMLKNTFNFQLSLQAINGYSPFICDDCITKIQQASTFKQMVLQSEEAFIGLVEKLKCPRQDDVTASGELKVEPIKPESPTMDYCGDSFDDDEILANIKLELSHNDAILDPMTSSYAHKKKTKLKNCKMKSETGNHKDWSRIAERRGNGPILRENSLKLLTNSTVFVFQWNKSRYRCFCCKEPYSDVDQLRQHAKTHDLKTIEKKIINQQNRLVKVEVSDLKCNICYENIENLDCLRDHLVTTHEIKFESSEHLLVPFKIGGELNCQICHEKFNVFRLLNIHVNKHFQKQVCHICGAGFSNLVFLNLHKTRSHKPLKCRHCEVNFTNKTDKKHHEMTVHNVKFERKLRFPCPYCSERFYQENFRVQHLVEKHGLKRPEFKCDICCKVFITKSLCNNHLKNVHLKEKSHECEVCHNLFYTKSDVSRHKVTHTGEKNFSCTMCNNPFASKDSLRRHMRRTHGVH